MFQNSFECLKKLLSGQQGKVEDSAELCSARLEVGKCRDGGTAALVSTLLACRWLHFQVHIPDQVIVFDPTIQNQPAQFGNLLERYRNLMNDATAAVEGGASSDEEGGGGGGNKRKRKRFAGTSSSECGSATIAAASDLPKLVTMAANLNSGPETEDSAMMNNSSSAARVQNQILIHTASRIALHMMREEMNQDSRSPSTAAAVNPSHVQDFFVLNACSVTVTIDPSPADRSWLFLDPAIKKHIIESTPATIPFPKPADTLMHDLYSDFELSAKTRACLVVRG